MPDESTNPVWTSQASQNNQVTTNQSWNDFVLDFWDLGNNDAPATEEVQVDSLSEEENSVDEMKFDIDLGTTDKDSSENIEETKSEADNWAENYVSIDTPEETVNDFDISMDYEWTSEEENTPENTEEVEQEGDKTWDNEEMAQDEEKLSGDEKVIDEELGEDNEEIVPDEETSEEEIIQNDALTFTTEDTNPEEKTENSGEKVSEEELVEDNEEMLPEEEISDNNEIIPDEVVSFSTDDGGSEETIDDNEEIVPDEGDASDESEMFWQDEKVDDTISENSESQNSEWHLFHQINEGDQNEMSFDFDYSDNNQSFQTDENTTNKPLFMSADDANIYEPEWQEWEITFNLPEVSDNIEWSTELDIEPETQKQPELGDLLSNSPIDLSKELNEGPEENIESDLWNMETPVDGVEAINDLELQETSSDSVTFEPVTEDTIPEETPNEIQSEPVLDAVAPEVISQDAESEPTMPVEKNDFLLDAPQVDQEAQRVEETVQPENVENNVEVQPQQQPQTDERSEAVNSVAAEMSEPNVATPEINISSPVELSNVSSSQRENVPVESENQVQSTLSLDQILDSELLTNPQYADNSKSSPQNAPVSGGKGKMWLFIGVWVAALACCVAVLAFPSISSERKPGDTVDTWISTEYPTGDEEPFGSAPEEPTDRQNPITEEPEPTGDQQTYTPDVSDLPGVWWGGQVVILPDDEDDWWDDETGTEPVPYVWSGDGDIDDPEIETPVIEEVDAGQILDIILSFKSQADTYYSHGEQTADKQLMKYALRLITVCDNYTDKVNNGEWVDSESLSTFKSTANKILSKINTYLGGDEDVPVIREATIDGESYFEWKDELKEYIYNNR